MNLLSSVANLFGASAPSGSFKEDFESVSSISTPQTVNIPSASALKEAFLKFPNGDLVHCDITIEETSPISFHSKHPDDIEKTLTDLRDSLQIADESPTLKVEITVEKKFCDEKLTIYSFQSFANFLSSLSMQRHFAEFSSRLTQGNAIRFICLEKVKEFNTESIWFINHETVYVSGTSKCNRDSLLAKRNEVCHFENSSAIQTIPDDFHLKSKSESDILNGIFDKLCVAVSVVFIADITRIKDENSICFKLNGYKAITGNVDWRSAANNLANIYFRIYQWIYEGGTIDDKIGLARNLLSLHAKNGNILELDADVFTSIKSGYQIYLKENVEQYIEIKNKLIEFVCDLSEKAAKLGEGLGDSLAQNFLAFATFFLTVIVINAIADKDFTGSFSPHLATIAYGLLVASFIHWIISLLLLSREIEQISKNYAAVKKRYSDLLDPKDLKNAFKNDEEYENILANINYKRRLYSCAWLGYIVIFAIVVARITTSEKPIDSKVGTTTAPTEVNQLTIPKVAATLNLTISTNPKAGKTVTP